MDPQEEIRRVMRLVTRLDARTRVHETVLAAIMAAAPDREVLETAWESAAQAIATSVSGPLAIDPTYQVALQAELAHMRVLLGLLESA